MTTNIEENKALVRRFRCGLPARSFPQENSNPRKSNRVAPGSPFRLQGITRLLAAAS